MITKDDFNNFGDNFVKYYFYAFFISLFVMGLNKDLNNFEDFLIVFLMPIGIIILLTVIFLPILIQAFLDIKGNGFIHFLSLIYWFFLPIAIPLLFK